MIILSLGFWIKCASLNWLAGAGWENQQKDFICSQDSV
jgi:hypothetical protein